MAFMVACRIFVSGISPLLALLVSPALARVSSSLNTLIYAPCLNYAILKIEPVPIIERVLEQPHMRHRQNLIWVYFRLRWKQGFAGLVQTVARFEHGVLRKRKIPRLIGRGSKYPKG
jgi:hypothetical protein